MEEELVPEPAEAAAGAVIPQRVPLTDEEKAAMEARMVERRERELKALAKAKEDEEAAAAAAVSAQIKTGKIKAINAGDFELLRLAASA